MGTRYRAPWSTLLRSVSIIATILCVSASSLGFLRILHFAPWLPMLLLLVPLLAAPFAINAHKSTTEAAVYVSCGEIVASAPTATPRTGGGGMASNSNPLAWAAIAALLTITVVGATYALRRRAA